MIRRIKRAWWYFRNIYLRAHLLPEWHRFYQAEIAKRQRSHKARSHLQSEFQRRKHEALRQEVSR